jgi:hypothetical protein
MLGPPGVGKTHLAIARGIKAIEAGHKVLFLTLESMLTRLTRARTENRVERQIQQFVYPKVLIIDEIGYLPMTRDEAGLFFRLLSRRYGKAATIITCNKSFVDWGEIFNDQVLATAILDRLLHHCTTLNIKGESYRLKEKERQVSWVCRPKPRSLNLKRTQRTKPCNGKKGTFYSDEKGTKKIGVVMPSFFLIRLIRRMPTLTPWAARSFWGLSGPQVLYVSRISLMIACLAATLLQSTRLPFLVNHVPSLFLPIPFSFWRVLLTLR